MKIDEYPACLRDDSQTSLRTLLLIGLLTGVVYALLSFPLSFFSGKGKLWNLKTNDVSTYVTGLRFYIHDEWRFPIFNAEGINYPEGTNIIYTDSIPLPALAAKILFKLTHIEWNYFGHWVFLNFILYALCIVLALDSLGIRTIPLTILTLCLAFSLYSMLTPLFHQHLALASHFVFPLGISLYFYSQRKSVSAKALRAWTVLLPVVLLINVYLFVIIIFLYAVTVIQAWRNGLISLKKAAFYFLLSFSVILAVAVISGHYPTINQKHFAPQAAWQQGGMDAAAPIVPLFLTSYAFNSASNLLSKQDNYVGFAVIALWIWILFRHPRKIRYETLQHWPIFLLFLLYYLFSLSIRIHAGGHLLADISLLKELLLPYKVFRHTSRFFWPVIYFAAITPMAFLWKHCKCRRKLLLGFVPLVLLQNAEVWNFRTAVYQKASRPDFIENYSVYENLFRQYGLVLIEEDYFQTSQPLVFKARAFYYIAGKVNTPTNYCYTGRKQIEAIPFDMLVKDALQSGTSTLFIVSEDTYKNSGLADYPIVLREESWLVVSNNPAP